MQISMNPWVWLAVFFTLSIYSFLYKDNPFYKFAEHVTVGVSVGYSMYILWTNAFIGQVWTPFNSGGTIMGIPISMRWDFIIPAVLGIFMIFRLFPKYAWMSRYTLAFLIGGGSGLALTLSMQARIFKQVSTSMVPITMDWMGFSNLIVIIGVLATLIYFYFSKEHKGVFGGVANVGIWYLMVGFGATFGYTVMARMSLFIGRLLFLFQDFLGLNLVN